MLLVVLPKNMLVQCLVAMRIGLQLRAVSSAIWHLSLFPESSRRRRTVVAIALKDSLLVCNQFLPFKY